MASSTLSAALAAAIVAGCNSTNSADTARQAHIDRFCSAPRTTRGSADAIGQCSGWYQRHPEVRLPDPADVPLAGEPGYDPTLAQAEPPPAPTQPIVLTPAPQPPPHPDDEAAITNDAGVKTVLGIINDALRVHLQIDSGASLVQVSPRIVTRLMQLGAPVEFVSLGSFQLADGSTTFSPIIRLRSLTIGAVTVENVLASEGMDDSAVLLGQSFLERLASWSIDNARGVLVLRQAASS
jgi:hypothetical protein